MGRNRIRGPALAGWISSRVSMMSRLILALATMLTAVPAHAADGTRPNVVFLLADDLRADTIAALGNPAARTPNLDALVRRGFALTNAYCFGGNSPAVCTPSRNMLLGGNAYFRWKDFVPPGMPDARKGLLAPRRWAELPAEPEGRRLPHLPSRQAR